MVRDWWVVISLKIAKKGWPFLRVRQWAFELDSTHEFLVSRSASAEL